MKCGHCTREIAPNVLPAQAVLIPHGSNAELQAKLGNVMPFCTVACLRDWSLQVSRDVGENTGSINDGYHTFDELYDHRVSLFIALCSEVDARMPTGYVWRSKLHSDGTMFGGGWFVMGIGTEPGEQITYHLPLSRWADTEWLGTERPRAPEFDGHTSEDVLQRLKRYAR